MKIAWCMIVCLFNPQYSKCWASFRMFLERVVRTNKICILWNKPMKVMSTQFLLVQQVLASRERRQHWAVQYTSPQSFYFIFWFRIFRVFSWILIDWCLINNIPSTGQVLVCFWRGWCEIPPNKPMKLMSTQFLLVQQVLDSREGGDIITLVPEVFLFVGLTFFGDFYWTLIGWLVKLSVQTFQPLIVI